MKNYGVIECDPIVLAGLDRTVSYFFFPPLFLQIYNSKSPLNLVMVYFLATV